MTMCAAFKANVAFLSHDWKVLRTVMCNISGGKTVWTVEAIGIETENGSDPGLFQTSDTDHRIRVPSVRLEGKQRMMKAFH